LTLHDALPIYDLTKRLTTSKTGSTIQSIQRQIDSKLKDQVRIQSKISDYQKQTVNKQKEIDRNQNSLTKALDQETKKRQNAELNFLRTKESYNRNELNNIQRLNSELEKQQFIFQDHSVSVEDIAKDDEE